MAFTTGQQVTAADLNDISQLRGVRARLASGSQNLTNDVATKVLFDTETFDPQTEFASSTFTAEAAGYYLVHANLTVLVNVNANLILQVYKNGSSYASVITNVFTTNATVSVPITTVVSLAITDTIEIYATQDGTAATDVQVLAVGGNNDYTRLEIVRLFNG